MREDKITPIRTVLSKKDRICRKIIEYGILGLIIFAPLPAASVYEWSILVIQLTVLLMLGAYLMMEKRPKVHPELSRLLKWPKYLFTGLFMLILIQILPLPRFLIKIFNPNTYSFQRSFSFDFLKIKFMSLSLVPSHTLQEGLELLSYFLLGFLIMKTVTRRRQIRRILLFIIAVGSFEAFYGLFELYRENPRILFYEKFHTLDSVTGTFVNRTNFSGFLEMIIPLAIGLIIARIDLISFYGKRGREKLIHLARKGTSVNLILAAAILLMSIAIILSKSRSGVFLLAFAFILFAGMTVLFFRRMGYAQAKIKSFLKITFVLIIIFSLYIGIGSTIERFALDKFMREGRPLYWSNVFSIAVDFPLLGSGLGTLSSIYPAYEKTSTWGKLIHAHNDYLEYLSELRVLGFTLLFGGIIFLVMKSFLIWRERGNPEIKGLALGTLVATIIMGIHSLTDFSWHIPANMLLFTVIVSLTPVIVTYGKARSEESGVRSKRIGKNE
jgi:O-antigen ligase